MKLCSLLKFFLINVFKFFENILFLKGLKNFMHKFFTKHKHDNLQFTNASKKK